MRIFAVDPGNKESAYVLYQHGQVCEAEKNNNDVVKARMIELTPDTVIVIEKIQSFGMAVGADVFDTCYWIGRFWEAAEQTDHGVEFVTRMEEKICLCKNSRAKDKNIRQALIDTYGDVPTKKRPNPFYGDIKLSGDMWSALAVAVTYMKRMEEINEIQKQSN